MHHYITEEDIVLLFQRYPPDDFVDEMSIQNIKIYLKNEEENGFSPRKKFWATIYATEHNLEHGATIKFFNKQYRNDGLYFWDAYRKEILEPL